MPPHLIRSRACTKLICWMTTSTFHLSNMLLTVCFPFCFLNGLVLNLRFSAEQLLQHPEATEQLQEKDGGWNDDLWLTALRVVSVTGGNGGGRRPRKPRTKGEALHRSLFMKLLLKLWSTLPLGFFQSHKQFLPGSTLWQLMSGTFCMVD